MQLKNTRKYYLQNAWAMAQFHRPALVKYFMGLADSRYHDFAEADNDDRYFVLNIRRPTDEELTEGGFR